MEVTAWWKATASHVQTIWLCQNPYTLRNYFFQLNEPLKTTTTTMTKLSLVDLKQLQTWCWQHASESQCNWQYDRKCAAFFIIHFFNLKANKHANKQNTCLWLYFAFKLYHASCTRTCKHTGDGLHDTKANWIYIFMNIKGTDYQPGVLYN